MPRRTFFRHFRSTRKTSLLPPFSEKQHTKKTKKPRYSTWVKYALQCSIPSAIAIFTIVSYLQDLKIAELAREKDWKIALTGLQIANQTHLQDQEIANEERLQDRKLVEEQREEDHQQQADLNYQELYSKYIDDISIILYKQLQYNQSMFLSEETRVLYIRRKTLFTLREIDSERRSQLFIFLYENNLLSDRTKPNSTISLEGADLHNITIKSPLTGKYIFNGLSLDSVNLVNSTFIDCIFTGGTHFIGSSMSNISFIDSRFTCEDKIASMNIFDRVTLDYSNFKNTFLCNTRFRIANLSSSSFVDVNMQQVSFIKTNLSAAVLDLTQKGILLLNNITLPNGTQYSSVPPIVEISSCARWNQNGITIAGDQNGLAGSDLSMLKTPLGIFIDINDDNTLYVADNLNKRVMKFNQGQLKGQVVAQGLDNLGPISLDEEQNLYVSDKSKIVKVAPYSVVGITVAGADLTVRGNQSDQLQSVSDFMLDEEKNLYICDGLNDRVVMWKQNAKSGILLASDTDRNEDGLGHLGSPRGIYVDLPDNSLYISDQRGHRIQRFHPIGNRTSETVAGTGEIGNSLYHLRGPTNVIVMNSKDIYVADRFNNRIVRWIIGNYSAGATCVVGCSGGSGVFSNMLKQVEDFKIDGKGNLIVSDTGNNRIQKFELVHNKC